MFDVYITITYEAKEKERTYMNYMAHVFGFEHLDMCSSDAKTWSPMNQ